MSAILENQYYNFHQRNTSRTEIPISNGNIIDVDKMVQFNIDKPNTTKAVIRGDRNAERIRPPANGRWSDINIFQFKKTNN